MPAMVMLHEKDPKEVIFDKIGDYSQYEVFNNDVLLAIYERPSKTAGGVILTDTYRGEDQFQSKVGLILKMGPNAFNKNNDGGWFKDQAMQVGDWVVFRVSDAWAVSVNKTSCRMISDTRIKARIPSPDMVW